MRKGQLNVRGCFCLMDGLVVRGGWTLTVQKVSGMKKIVTYVRSLMFSPSCVAARLSITALALKS